MTNVVNRGTEPFDPNADTLYEAFGKINEAFSNTVSYYTTKIEVSDWVGEEPSVATKTISGIKETDKPIVDIDLSSVSFIDIPIMEGEWSLVYRVEASDDDEFKIYATETPLYDIDIQIKIIR